jgi:hypothetical protein
LVARQAVGRPAFPRGKADLFEQLLQRKRNFLFPGKSADFPEHFRTDGREALERDADAAAGDFFRQLIDGKSDLRGDVVRPWFEEMGGYTGQDIAKAKKYLLLLLGGV